MIKATCSLGIRLVLIGFLLSIGGIFVVGTNSVFAAEEMTITDLAGREVTLTIPAERIVIQESGSGGPFFTIFALAGEEAPEKIVGMDPGLRKNRQWIWKKYIERFPELQEIPDVGRSKDLNIEKVIGLQPDVVVVSNQAYQTTKDVFTKLQSAGIPVVVIDYHVETLEAHKKSILLLGKLLGEDERAKELADFYEEQYKNVSSQLAKITTGKPTVYIEVGSKGPSGYGNSYGAYMWGALVEKSGGDNITSDVIERYGPINPEYLLKADPDVIVLTGSYWPANPTAMKLGYYADPQESGTLLQTFLTRQGWETLSAVKQQRMYTLHHGLSREIWDFFAIQCFAKWFYPEEFTDLDPEANFKEFHERFLPIDYSGIWMMELTE